MKTASERDQLYKRLHPADAFDVPVPGFPSHEALVAWARTRDRERIRSAALDTLREDGWPQQYAVMALLRELGVSVEGEGHGGNFRWVIDPWATRQIVVPRHLPAGEEPVVAPAGDQTERSGEAGPWERELRTLLSSAISGLDENAQMVFALHCIEGLTGEQISVVLGTDATEDVLGRAVQELREHLSPTQLEEIRRCVAEAPADTHLHSPTFELAALLAA